MKKHGLVTRIAVIVNAILLVVAFVGCPSRRGKIIPHIAPPPMDFREGPATIAPPPGHFQRLLPPEKSDAPPDPDGLKDKRNP